MDEGNKEFAEELIKHYGEDRFYHSCMKTSNILVTKRLFISLNGKQVDFDSKSKSLGLNYLPPMSNQEPLTYQILKDNLEEMGEEESRFHLCRIAFGLCNSHKSFGLKNKELPPHLHARMIFGEKNEWVEKYANIMRDS